MLISFLHSHDVTPTKDRDFVCVVKMFMGAWLFIFFTFSFKNS